MEKKKAKEKEKILIIEDDQFLRELYEELLTEEGYEAKIAIDGKEGLAAMKRGGTDLVLLDIIMPKMDGLDILRNLTEKEKKKCGPIILLTNLGQESVIKDGFNLGATGYLIKSSYNPDQVLHEIRVFLEKAKS